jgi:hypothetical protein
MNGAPESVGCFGKNELRGWVGPVVMEGEVTSIEVDEEVGEDKEHQKRGSGQEYDQEKVRLFGR